MMSGPRTENGPNRIRTQTQHRRRCRYRTHTRACDSPRESHLKTTFERLPHVYRAVERPGHTLDCAREPPNANGSEAQIALLSAQWVVQEKDSVVLAAELVRWPQTVHRVISTTETERST